MRIISVLLANTCCYSSQAPEQKEPEVDNKNIEKMPALSLSLSALHDSLRPMTQALNTVGGGATGQIRKDVQSGCILAGRLWNLQDLQSKRYSRTFKLQGHIELSAEDGVDEDVKAQTSGRKGKATVDVGIARPIDTATWLQNFSLRKIHLVPSSYRYCNGFWTAACLKLVRSAATPSTSPMRNLCDI